MNKIRKIVVTGPESTGKTTLCRQLSLHFNTVYIPEYARTFIEKLNRPYTYKDIEHIAYKQVELQKEFVLKANSYLFYDTYLIITKIWFKWCYNKYPGWLDHKIAEDNIDMYLLLNTDIAWRDDGVRENPGAKRNELMRLYRAELDKLNKKYSIINGIGDTRFHNAIKALKKILKT
jgi:NadR type nicotinamide-nucleotide adenylyltransferase